MKKILLVLMILISSVFAEKVVVFSASSTKLAMAEVIKAFEAKHKDAQVEVYYSATGKAFAQFTNGFKYDVFIAADSTYPVKLVEQGDALDKPRVYALGAVALYSKNPALVKEGLKVLTSDKVKNISIANPRVAPYGVVATEIMEKLGIYKEVEKKIVRGENIGQSVQFVDKGAAEVGLVAFSLIKTSVPADEYMVIPQSNYTPLEQSFVLTKYAKGNKSAEEFGNFLVSPEAKKIIESFGFGVPN